MGDRVQVARVGTGEGIATTQDAKASPRLRLPLALVVSRYFLYLLVGIILVVGVPLAVFGGQMGAGEILPANYGETHLEEVADTLSAQPAFDATAIPSPYRYAHFDAGGALVASDMSDFQLERARVVAASPARTRVRDGGAGAAESRLYYRLSLTGGEVCVLSYDLVPQWADKGRRDTLPDPQSLLFWSVGPPLVALIAGVAARASRMLTRMMEPLVRAAEAVGRQDLDAPVEHSNVAQVDDVLQAMDKMRISLRRSLEAQWEVERRGREQVAALAHDLKTPLTVVRGNAELMAEDAAAGRLNKEQATCADAICEAATAMDAFVSRIVEVSRGAADTLQLEPVDPGRLAEELEEEATRLTVARGLTLAPLRLPAFLEACRAMSAGDAPLPLWDSSALKRAVLNVVGNACDYTVSGLVELTFSYGEEAQGEEARGGGARAFSIAVEDDGPGLSPEALKHGLERFYRGERSRASHRTGAGGPDERGEPHFGLGLSIASEIVAAHGGRLSLSNRMGGDGAILGARVTITLPGAPRTPGREWPSAN